MVDRIKVRGYVHAGQEPRGTDASPGAEFKKPTTRLGHRQHLQEGAGLRLRGHRESQSLRVLKNGRKGLRRRANFPVIHGRDSSTLLRLPYGREMNKSN